MCYPTKKARLEESVRAGLLTPALSGQVFNFHTRAGFLARREHVRMFDKVLS